jgi:uncharacterized protein
MSRRHVRERGAFLVLFDAILASNSTLPPPQGAGCPQGMRLRGESGGQLVQNRNRSEVTPNVADHKKTRNVEGFSRTSLIIRFQPLPIDTFWSKRLENKRIDNENYYEMQITSYWNLPFIIKGYLSSGLAEARYSLRARPEKQSRSRPMARFEYSSRDIVEFAAEGGAPDALFELGLMYASGRDVQRDFVSAHKWFNVAALRGNDEAKRYRLELSREMTRQEISRAQKLAREWISKH